MQPVPVQPIALGYEPPRFGLAGNRRFLLGVTLCAFSLLIESTLLLVFRGLLSFGMSFQFIVFQSTWAIYIATLILRAIGGWLVLGFNTEGMRRTGLARDLPILLLISAPVVSGISFMGEIGAVSIIRSLDYALSLTGSVAAILASAWLFVHLSLVLRRAVPGTLGRSALPLVIASLGCEVAAFATLTTMNLWAAQPGWINQIATAVQIAGGGLWIAVAIVLLLARRRLALKPRDV